MQRLWAQPDLIWHWNCVECRDHLCISHVIYNAPGINVTKALTFLKWANVLCTSYCLHNPARHDSIADHPAVCYKEMNVFLYTMDLSCKIRCQSCFHHEQSMLIRSCSMVSTIHFSWMLTSLSWRIVHGAKYGTTWDQLQNDPEQQ